MKKRGFIATSLIYSFFLVFLAILAGLIRNYVANKVILDRFNEEAAYGLNNNTYKLTVVAYNSDIKNGHSITNLIQNGNFTEEISHWWTSKGNVNISRDGVSPRARITASAPSSYIFQNVSIYANKTYYMRVDYIKNFDTSINVNVANGNLQLKKVNSLSRSSMNFVARNTVDRTPFIIGNSNAAYNNPIIVTNVMLINLTDHYEKGNVPTADWLDENIDFFDGTISYTVEDHYSQDSYEIELAGSMDYKKAYLTCQGQNGNWTNIANRELNTTYDSESKRYLTTVKLENITDDIKCNVRWSK